MKAYVIAFVDIKDREGYMKDFMPRSVKAIEAGGGKFLVRGGKTGGAALSRVHAVRRSGRGDGPESRERRIGARLIDNPDAPSMLAIASLRGRKPVKFRRGRATVIGLITRRRVESQTPLVIGHISKRDAKSQEF